MIYEKELVHYRNTNFKHPRGLQIFASQNNDIARMLKNSQLCSSSIHGVQYLWEPKSRPIVRLFWLLVILAAIGFFVAMYGELTERHREQVLSTVVETSQLPIYSINFPSVAVCPWSHINWVRYKGAEEKFLPSNASSTVKGLFFSLLSAMESASFTRFDPIQAIMNLTFPSSIENIILHDLMQFMAFRCDELFVSCTFGQTVHDCCKIFVAERTERGFCMVFNSLISEESRIKKLTDAFYPWKIRTSGEGSGLTFTLRQHKNFQKPNSKIPFAFNIMIKESEEWSESIFHYIVPNTLNYLSITPIITEAAPNTRGMDPQKRRCLFADEDPKMFRYIEGLPFNKLNCRSRCQQDSVITLCNCTLSNFFPEWSSHRIRECTVTDLPCLYNHRDVFNYMKSPLQDDYIKETRRGMECDCIDNCMAIVFLISPNTNRLPIHNSSATEVKADIYIGRNVMTKYGARLDYTSMDLVANFGGVLGLYLGASVLSMSEIIYFSFKIIIVWLMSKLKMRRKRRKVNFIKNAKMNKK